AYGGRDIQHGGVGTQTELVRDRQAIGKRHLKLQTFTGPAAQVVAEGIAAAHELQVCVGAAQREVVFAFDGDARRVLNDFKTRHTWEFFGEARQTVDRVATQSAPTCYRKGLELAAIQACQQAADVGDIQREARVEVVA